MPRPGFTLCVCPDSRLTKTHINGLLTDHPPASADVSFLAAPAPGVWERHVYWGDEPLPSSFWEDLTLQGLFAVPKAVLVYNAQNIPADSWRTISQTLGKPLGDTWPIFCLQVDFDKGAPKIPAHIAKLHCVTFASSKGWLWLNPGLDARSKAEFVRGEAARLGLQFAPGAFEAAIARLPFDATTIVGEMEKLALAVGADNTITQNHAAFLELEPEPDIFSLIRNLQHGGNPTAVWQQAALSERGESMVFGFLSMLAREARQLWQLAHNENVRLPSHVLSAKTALARSLGLPGIAKLWQLALEADKGIKTGERSPDQALDSLFAALALLFRRRSGQ